MSRRSPAVKAAAPYVGSDGPPKRTCERATNRSRRAEPPELRLDGRGALRRLGRD
jgi:hypothetical protein